MRLIKKKDVRNYLSVRRRNAGTAMRLVSNPENEDPQSTDQTASEKKQREFVEDFSAEHNSPGGAVTAVVTLTPDESPASE